MAVATAMLIFFALSDTKITSSKCADYLVSGTYEGGREKEKISFFLSLSRWSWLFFGKKSIFSKKQPLLSSYNFGKGRGKMEWKV